MKRNTDRAGIKKRYFFVYVVTLVLLTFLSSSAVWADGFGIANNQITITTSDASYTPSVTTAGVVDTVNGMTGDLQSMSFSLVKQNVTDATYTADLGVIVDDVNNDRRIEASLLGVDIVVAGNDITINVAAGHNVQLAGRNNDGTVIFITELQNLSDDSPLVVSGASATVNFTNLITKIEDKFGAASGEASVLNDITKNGSYTYQVFIKSTSAAVGTVDGTGTVVTPFTSLTDIGTSGEYADSSIATYLSATATIPNSPTDAEISPISNSSYLNGSCYILDGAYSVGSYFTLDVDGNGVADALTDGILIVRYLFNATGTTLINGAYDPSGTRNTATLIEDYLTNAGLALDIDGNGVNDALTDGILIVRYLFNATGTTLINGAYDPSGSRNTATLIESYLDSLAP